MLAMPLLRLPRLHDLYFSKILLFIFLFFFLLRLYRFFFVDDMPGLRTSCHYVVNRNCSNTVFYSLAYCMCITHGNGQGAHAEQYGLVSILFCLFFLSLLWMV